MHQIPEIKKTPDQTWARRSRRLRSQFTLNPTPHISVRLLHPGLEDSVDHDAFGPCTVPFFCEHEVATLGGIKEDWGSVGWKSPSGVQVRSPGKGSEGQSPPEA